MNDIKRNKINQAIYLSKRMRQSISQLDSDVDASVKRNLDTSISACESICGIIKTVISDEVNAHKNVPHNLYSAENTYQMRSAVKYLYKAFNGYTTILSGLKTFSDKCGIDHWLERVYAAIDYEVSAEYLEKQLKVTE